MERPLIAMSSITYAMRAKDILFKYGINSNVERMQKFNNNKGCGYSLYVPKDIYKARKILSEHGIKMIDMEGETG